MMQAELTENTPAKLTTKSLIALVVTLIFGTAGTMATGYQFRDAMLKQAALEREAALRQYVTRDELQQTMDKRFERWDTQFDTLREEVRALKSAVERIR